MKTMNMNNNELMKKTSRMNIKVEMSTRTKKRRPRKGTLRPT
jgi:hypothetical protein